MVKQHRFDTLEVQSIPQRSIVNREDVESNDILFMEEDVAISELMTLWEEKLHL